MERPARAPRSTDVRVPNVSLTYDDYPGGSRDKDTRNPLVTRTHTGATRFFEGYDMVKPALVPTSKWRPDSAPGHEDPGAFSTRVGVGRTA